jgi:hypothetical protein
MDLMIIIALQMQKFSFSLMIAMLPFLLQELVLSRFPQPCPRVLL